MMKFISAIFFCALALPCFAGSFTDSRDNQTYKTVKIGKQTWMAKNLNFKTSNSWCYDNDNENCDLFGRLYSWDAAKKACPSGWRLPSKGDFEKLQEIAGGERTGGKELKAEDLWAGRNDGTDSYGFAAVAAGLYDDGYKGFFRAGTRAHFWSSTVFMGSHYYFFVLTESDIADLQKGPKENGLSVRCIKE